MNIKRDSVYIFLGLIIMSLLFLTHARDLTWNDRSRLATIESLIERRTFTIDLSSFTTGDKVFINGHFYSDKPPLLSVVLAGVYAVIYAAGITFASHHALVTYLLTGSVSVIPFIAYFIFFAFLFARHTLLVKGKMLLLIGALAIGTALFPYATVLNNHIIAGVLAGAAALSLYWYPRPAPRACFMLGMASGLAIAFDPGTLFIVGPFILFLLVISLRRVKGAALGAADRPPQLSLSHRLIPVIMFVLGGVMPILAHYFISRTITGDIWPASLHPEFFNYPGTKFNSVNLTNASLAVSSFTGWLGYLAQLLVGRRGLLTLTPLVLVGIIQAVRVALVRGAAITRRLHAFATLLAFGGVLLYYSLYGKDFGGPSYAVRWFIILIPLVLPYVFDWGASSRLAYRAIIAIALLSAWWNIPASGSVFSNLNSYPRWQGGVVIERFPAYLKEQIELFK